MRKSIMMLCLIGAFFGGLTLSKQPQTTILFGTKKQTPINETKNFVFVVYAHNHKLWIERNLRSIFEQEYENYKTIFIDDASQDDSLSIAYRFTEENNQQDRTIFIRHEESIGYFSCLEQIIREMPDQEIVIPLLAKDWISHSNALNCMNEVFQNPDVWLAKTKAISFPLYEETVQGFEGFYAAVFKQLPKSAIIEGKRGFSKLHELASGRSKEINDILLFSNTTAK
jgi:glycosyltransferase involved in cell wall biosynthesis